MNQFKRILLGSLLGAASLQALACYTVVDAANRVVYRGEQAPVDMSRPLHETVPARFPGGHMVFDAATECATLAVATPAPVRGGTPLLTNSSTAEAMQLPYRPMGGGIALVQPRESSMGPGVTVLPSATALAAARTNPADATRAMGAGPAPRR